MSRAKRKILKNGSALMVFHIAKIIFPFVVLPYLTRVLSTEAYGTVAYVKTVMNYMQIFVDFGFVLSATKDVVEAREDHRKLGGVVGDTMTARILLGLIGFLIVLILSLVLPILRENFLFTVLSYVTVFLSIFLMDFLFRGLEIMHVITIRFVAMKVISTGLTFLLIKNDADLLLIPILDILSSIVAIVLVFRKKKELGIRLRFCHPKTALKPIKTSFVYFLSSVASTSFSALSTILIGIYFNATEVAYWSLCAQIIGTVQACYSPISDSIYPEMIKHKDLSVLKKVIRIFAPIAMVGSIVAFLLASTMLGILGGEKYLSAVPILRILIIAIPIGFFGIIFGWPALGAIGKVKETTISTIASVLLNVLLLVLLILTGTFTLINVAIARVITEFSLFAIRFFYFQKYKQLFRKGGA